jgi:UDP-glucose 4-epimerase
MKVLVTGGAGFIGGHVADAYVARGDEVWVVDDLSTGKPSNVPPGVAGFLHASVLSAEARELCRTEAFDLVNHHAAQVDVRVSVVDPVRDASTNLLGLLNILEGVRDGIRESGAATRVVNVSSGGVVYGEGVPRPTVETAPKLPASPYGVAKLTAEVYLDYYRRLHGLEAVTLRYANVFGPRQDPHGEAGVVAIFSQRLLSGEPLTIFGDGEQTRDYVFVGDVVRANLMVGEAPLPTGDALDDYAFNVGTGAETSVHRLADTLEQVAGTGTGRIYRDARLGELRYSSLDTDRLRGLGWAPRVSLEEGLRATFGWIRDSGSDSDA